MKTVSFKEVHKELELESMFLNKKHDISSFKEKGTFLSKIGFENSIATRIYNGVTDAQHLINEYKVSYPNYKFILQPQLERVLEKYNLYQRDCKYFMGDIPEKNIKDIQNFKVIYEDLPKKLEKVFKEFLGYTYNMLQNKKRNNPDSLVGSYIKSIECLFNSSTKLACADKNNPSYKIGLDNIINSLNAINTINNTNGYSPLTICAVESLFNQDAWKEGKQRIIGKKEIEAKSQVDLDPIVLFEVEGGYLIVTAWGDEANDELIFNESLN